MVRGRPGPTGFSKGGIMGLVTRGAGGAGGPIMPGGGPISPVPIMEEPWGPIMFPPSPGKRGCVILITGVLKKSLEFNLINRVRY